MKIIVSSEFFQRIVALAIGQNPTSFDVVGKDNQIGFHGESKHWYPVDVIPKDSHITFSGKFEPKKWSRIARFLGDLEDQPIVVEFTGDDEGTYIEFSHCIMKF